MTKPIHPEAISDELEGVRRLARSLARSAEEADDLVQDTMVAALQNRTRIRSGLGAWLSGVARNVARRTARSAGRRAKYEGLTPPVGSAPSTADVVVRAAEQSRVLNLLVSMEEPYRSAVLLRYVEGLPPRVIARRMDLPVETVRTHLKRGLQRLREQFQSAHGGHVGETRAALILAASETLGAGHARAVALARASGLVVLVALGGALLWSLTREDDASSDITYISEHASPQAPSDASAGVSPGVSPSRAPTAAEGETTASTTAGSEATADDTGPEVAAAPAKPVAEPRPEPTPVVSRPLAPPPSDPPMKQASPPATGRRAVEDDVPERGAPKKDSETEAGPEEGEDGGGDFYDGETSFSSKQVAVAILKGVSWLKSRQGRNGSWGGIQFNSTYDGQESNAEGMPAGPTALALYALLKCKASPRDPAVRRGFQFLRKAHPKPASSYESSMLLLALTATADQDKLLSTARKKKHKPKLTGAYRGWAVKVMNHLLDKREGQGWRYNIRPGASPSGGNQDLSSTQLAALSLFAAHRLGLKVKRAVWEDILAFTLEQQEAKGPEVRYPDPVDRSRIRTAQARGFAYILGAQDEAECQPRGGMTACGLANLEMARFVLSDGGRKRAQWQKRGDAQRVQTALYDGLAWLDKNWSPFEDPHAEQKNVYHVYWLYALERAMDLLDLKLIGNHRWYSEMGQQLLNRQSSDGHWDARGTGRGHDVLDTCFALLFLKRATQEFIPFGAVTGGSALPPGKAPPDNR